MKRTVMIKAWAKVRAMKAEGYTGSTSLMLSVAMKAAWAEVKSMEETSSIDVNSLPVLQGSEKQIAWATMIRKNFVKELNRKIAESDVDFEEMQGAYYNGIGAVKYYHKCDAAFIAYNQMFDFYKKSYDSNKECMCKAEDYFYECGRTANDAGRDARKKAKETGLSKDEIKKTGKIAWFSKLKNFYVKMCLDSLMSEESCNAEIWIDAYKDSKYNRTEKKDTECFSCENRVITKQNVDYLTACGAKRWTKGMQDRLYINEKCGFELVNCIDGGSGYGVIEDTILTKKEYIRLCNTCNRTYIDLNACTIHLDESSEFCETLLSKLKEYIIETNI